MAQSAKKRKKQNILIERHTSLFVFFYPALVTICAIYYILSHPKFQILSILIPIIFLGYQFYFSYYGKRVVVTEQKIYVFSRNKKLISWHLLNDFAYISYEKSRLGTLFAFGTLIIVNQNKEMYSYFYLNDYFKVFETIIKKHEQMVKEVNPDYEIRYNPNPDDKLDKIEE